MSTNADNTKIWIRVETFVYGAIPIVPHPRLSLHNILKIIPYAKSRKGGFCYPNLPYTIWRNIALYKLQLPKALAWMYFSTYNTIDDSITAEDRITLDEKIGACHSPEEIEKVRDTVSVPLLKFTLFLFLQHFHVISIRDSLTYDEWPSDTENSTAGQNPYEKSFNEQTYMSFVQKKLGNMLHLLAEPAANQQDRSYLTMESVEALNILFMGSVDNMRSEKPLHSTVFAHAGRLSSSNSKLYEVRSLQTWLLDHLATSPFGVSTCIRTGRQLAWIQNPNSSATSTSDSRPQRHGRVVTNAANVPANSAAGNKIIILSRVCQRWVAKISSATLDNAAVKIHRCHNSVIYLLAPLRSVNIEKCRNTQIVLGAVETTVHIVGCEGVTVTTACRRFTAARNSSCIANLMTPNRPLILAGNDLLRIAPFLPPADSYHDFEQHLYDAGLTTSTVNLWDHSHALWSTSASSVSNLPSDQWYRLQMPFIGYPRSTFTTSQDLAELIPIPEEYYRVESERMQTANDTKKRITEISPDQRDLITRVLEEEFISWLQKKKSILQIRDFNANDY